MANTKSVFPGYTDLERAKASLAKYVTTMRRSDNFRAMHIIPANKTANPKYKDLPDDHLVFVADYWVRDFEVKPEHILHTQEVPE